MKTLLRAAGLFAWGCLAVGMAGCVKNGDDGAPGAPGATVVTTPSTPNTIVGGQDLPGVVIAVTGVSGGSGANGNVRAGDTISITFTVKKKDGNSLLISELSSSGIYVSGPSFNYQRVIPSVSNWHTAAVQNADGSYTYTLPTPIPFVYAAPYNDTASFGSGDGELTGQALLDGTYTVGLQAYRYYYDATTSYRDVGNAEKDFLYGGATTIQAREIVKDANCNQCHTTLQAHGGSRRDVKLCLLCHTSGAEDKNVASVEGGTPGVSIDFRVMIHKIHNAAHLPSVQGVTTNGSGARDYAATPQPCKMVGYNNSIVDFSEINFPVWPSMAVSMPRDAGYSALSTTAKTQETALLRGVVACDKCHGDPDGSGTTYTAPAQGGLCYSQPSRRGCGSCHDDIVWANPYVANGATMDPQADDSDCASCHTATGATWDPASDLLPSDKAHRHPFNDATLNPGVKFAVTSIAGGTGAGGSFQAGNPVTVNFTVKNDAGADIPIASLDSCSVALVGPTQNRQYVLPNASANPFDFSGRLASSSTTNKPTMTKGFGAAVTEVLTVDFTSGTAFDVIGSASGALGSGSLAAATGTNPSGSSMGSVELTAAAVAQQITVTFTDATHFDVSGSVSGPMGSGVLPASTSATVRFVSADAAVSFIITVGTTAFAAAFPKYMYLAVVKCTAPNPALFAVVGGRTAAVAGDRFYCEVVDASLTAYSYKIPMDLSFEFLGDGNGAVAQALPAAANLPVYFGRQTLYERTALVGAATALSSAVAANDRYLHVAVDPGFAIDDYLVLEDGVAGREEYVRVSGTTVVTGGTRVGITTPLRYSHAAAAPLQECTLTFLQYGVSYTMVPATGVVTSVTAFGAGNAVVMSYRSDARWGWKRTLGDAAQASYYSPIGNSTTYDQSWGEWTSLAYLPGTYTVGIWGYKSLNLGLNGEVQTYRCTSNAATKDVLYGTATTVEPRAAVASQATCNACHNDVLFHGGGRRGADACLMCHGEAGGQVASGETIDFRTMLHKVHMGRGLANASTYFSGDFAEVGFPAMPGEAAQCTACHGSSNTVWKEPADRKHPSQTTPTRTWRAVCGSCHDSDGTTSHFNLMTDLSGVESCTVCHGDGAEHGVALKHKIR